MNERKRREEFEKFDALQGIRAAVSLLEDVFGEGGDREIHDACKLVALANGRLSGLTSPYNKRKQLEKK